MDAALYQKLAQIDQEYAQKRTALMQGAYNMNGWGGGQTAQQPPAPAQNVNWIQVSGIEGAKNQIVQPGQTAWMMDNNAPYFYVKSVDGVGSSTFRIFQFAEVPEITPEPAQPQIDPSQYVQRTEFDELKARLDQLTSTQRKQPVKADKGAGDNG